MCSCLPSPPPPCQHAMVVVGVSPRDTHPDQGPTHAGIGTQPAAWPDEPHTEGSGTVSPPLLPAQVFVYVKSVQPPPFGSEHAVEVRTRRPHAQGPQAPVSSFTTLMPLHDTCTVYNSLGWTEGYSTCCSCGVTRKHRHPSAQPGCGDAASITMNSPVNSHTLSVHHAPSSSAAQWNACPPVR